MRDRGQLYTLEGITAGLVILLGLFFALQATTATPGAAGTLNPHAEQQDRASAQAALNAMSEPTLKDAVLYWEAGTSNRFHCAPSFVESGHYPGYADIGPSGTCSDSDVPNRYKYPSNPPAREYDLPPNEFGKMLNERFGEGYSYNVFVTFHDPSGGFDDQSMIFQGQPDASAVRATASVTLLDDDALRDVEGNPTSTDIGDDSSHFYADDVGSGEFFNELYVEVVVWRS